MARPTVSLLGAMSLQQIPDETIAWAQRGPPWSELRRFAALASSTDVARAVLAGVFYALRNSGFVLGSLNLFSLALRTAGIRVAVLPAWTQLAGLVSTALVIPLDARRLTLRLALRYCLILAVAAAIMFFGVWWWVTWIACSVVIASFSATSTISVLAVLGHCRSTLERNAA